MCLTRSNGTVMQTRQSPGAPTEINFANETPGPYWVKLVRAGNTFTGSDSTDGVTWEEITRVTINAMPSTVLAGLAVTSHEAGVERTAVFDNVLVSGPAGSPPAAPSGLQATLTSATTADLTWVDNSTDETYFLVERAAAGGAFVQRGTPTANSTRMSDTGLSPGTTYQYRVSAVSNNGSSAYSAVATVTTPPASGTPPNAPSGAVAVYWSNRIDIQWVDNSLNETNFVIERATDGATFQAIATLAANTIGYSDANLVGGTSRLNYSYRVRATNTNGSSASSPVATVEVAGNRPGFTTRNIGVVNPAGRMGYNSNGSWTVAGAGADIWGNADAFAFESQPWSGDGEFVARVDAFSANNSWAKAGIMFREGLDPAARNVLVAAASANGSEMQTRTSFGGTTTFAARATTVTPLWLKLTRQGSVFRAYRSADGVSWTDFATLTLDLSGPLYVGLAVTSHEDGSLATALFSNTYFGPIRGGAPGPAAPSGLQASASSPTAVSLTWIDNSPDETGFHLERATAGGAFVRVATPGANVTQAQDNGLTASTTYSYRISSYSSVGDSTYSNTVTVTTPASPPPPPGPGPTFSTRNIGAVSPAGSTTYDSGTGTWSVSGSGADIWENADAFTYESQAWTGDGEFVARVRSLDFTHGWAKAGLMFRETLAPESRNVFFAVTPDNGLEMQARTSTGGGTAFWTRAAGAAPVWLKLVRFGNSFNAYQSADGVTWQTLGGFTLQLQTSLYVGLAVTSHAPGTLTTARFSDVYLGVIRDGATSPPAAPTNLTAIARSFSEVELRWTDNASNESGVRIERSTDNTTFDMITTLPANAVTYNDRTTAASTTYYYRVRMINSAGVSGFSTASVTTPSVTTTPLTGPSGLVVTAVTASQIDLRWTDNDTSETGFQLERSTDGVNYAFLRSFAANALSGADTTVTASTQYYYRLRAVRGSDVSGYSNVVSATAANPTWVRADIGAVGVAGSETVSGTTVTLRGSGEDIWGGADGFSFRYLRI
ncbi:MAG TPA: fibronectin type III domain-containing protein, partial [Opitutaceae bacterium]|nr:fibronectin type III domain-containing protein [Opitutaceae bacterium]